MPSIETKQQKALSLVDSICGLHDIWTQSKICNRNPETLTEAIQLVQTLRCRQEGLQAVRAATASSMAVVSGLSQGAAELTWVIV